MNSTPEDNASKFRAFLLKRGDKYIEKKGLEILDAIDAPVNTDLVENCHRIPSKGFPKKVILKPNRRKNSRRILLNKKKLKQLKPVLELDCSCENLHQWEFMSKLRKIMDKIQEIMECQAKFVLLGQ